MTEQTKISPFIKWVGGKKQLLPELIKYAPKKFNTYYEPFLGGGAFLYQLQPQTAVVNDANGELINAYQQVKDHPNELITELAQLFAQDNKENYLKIRSVDRNGEISKYSNIDRAIRFIYINKAGFNGLWRVNRKGQCNVPYGQHSTLKVPENTILSDSKYFNNADIKFLNGDYQSCVKSAQKHDFVYFDPPYAPLTLTSNFTSYTKNDFGLLQQKQLRDLALDLAQKGVYVMLSNSYTDTIKKLYANKIFHWHKVKAKRSINSNAKKRGKVSEVLITTYL